MGPRNVIVIVLVLNLLQLSVTDWTTSCLRVVSCRCTWSSGKRLADCGKANLNSIPNLSSEIQILDMTGNKLPVLHDNAFTAANLINLQKLYLRSCKIARIHDLAFNNLRIMIEVDLSFNEIELIDPSIFSTNERLRVIKLNNNKIKILHEFPVLQYLGHLDLGSNLLSNFTRSTFSRAEHLKVIDLSNNTFSNLDPSGLPNVSNLHLRGNPWNCDCLLKPLRNFVLGKKIYEPEIKCAEPPQQVDVPWDELSPWSCKPEITNILANGKVVDSLVAFESILTLTCVVTGEPLPEVKWVMNGRVQGEKKVQRTVFENQVMLNLTVEKHDNEFVCTGSNSGGVAERNLSVTIDGVNDLGLLKDGDVVGGFTRSERGSGLIIYLVIGVVFLSLIVGLVVGGVCVWKWGKIQGARDDTVVKSVIKDEGTTKVVDEHDMVVHTSGLKQHDRASGGSVQGFAEQLPLLRPHSQSADDLNFRPTPDLLINGSSLEPTDTESIYSPNKFPDNASVYENYDLLFNKPLLHGSLRRVAFERPSGGYSTPPHAVYSSLKRPSSVCSEPRGNNTLKPHGNDTVILPHGYVTLPRRTRNPPTPAGPIRYDNLGPRTSAEGSSNFSLNKVGVDPDVPAAEPPSPLPPPPILSNATPSRMLAFDPIYEDENETEEVRKKKTPPKPPPKPKKKVTAPVEHTQDSDDGTEI